MLEEKDILTFSLTFSITATKVASEPVPAVVGITMNGFICSLIRS